MDASSSSTKRLQNNNIYRTKVLLPRLLYNMQHVIPVHKQIRYRAYFADYFKTGLTLHIGLDLLSVCSCAKKWIVRIKVEQKTGAVEINVSQRKLRLHFCFVPLIMTVPKAMCSQIECANFKSNVQFSTWLSKSGSIVRI